MLKSSPLDETTARRQFAGAITLFIVVSLGIVFAMLTTAKPWTYGGNSIFGQTFLVGPTAESLVKEHRLLVCTRDMGTMDPICFASARMPIVSGSLAVGALLLGDKPRAIAYLKNLVYLLPLWAAAACMLWPVRANRRLLWLSAGIMMIPLLLPNFTGIIINLDAEECYLYGVLALVIALMAMGPRDSVRWVIALALSLDFLFLCKSSMLPAFLVVAIGAIAGLRSTRLRLLLVLLVALAPVGWAVRQHQVSGRFSVGTSLDGLNFHKGNNIDFLDRYPKANTLLDTFDVDLSRGIHFDSEWQFNDYHLAAGKRFVIEHPAYTLRSCLRKAWVMFFSLNRMASRSYGHVMTAVLTVTILLFRLVLWSSFLLALYSAFTGKLLGRLLGYTYVGFVLAYYAPYIAGFGYMRHIIMMAYPSVVILVAALTQRGNQKATSLVQ